MSYARLLLPEERPQFEKCLSGTSTLAVAPDLHESGLAIKTMALLGAPGQS
jgi:hypothetical protein